MESFLALPRFARGPVASVALGLALAAGLSGCTSETLVDTGPFLGHIESVLAQDGSLHVLARLRTGEDEGGNFEYGGFLYAAPKGKGYDVIKDPLGDGEKAESTEMPYHLAFDKDDRPVLLADTASGLVVHVRDSGAWKELAPYENLSADDRADLKTPHQLGTAWTGEYGDVQVMYGHSIFSVGGDLSQLYFLDKSCALADDCTYDPTSDSTGDAARYDHAKGKYVLQHLGCPNFCDAWSDAGVLGDDDQGGSSEPLRRVFFHTKDGKGVLVRPVSTPDAADDYAVVADDATHRITVLSKGAEYIGAAPRPDGGFAVAALGSDKGLKLLMVGADDKIQEIELGTIDFGSQPIGVHVRAKSGEQVHVVVRESRTSVAHFVVSLPAGSFTKESIQMQ